MFLTPSFLSCSLLSLPGEEVIREPTFVCLTFNVLTKSNSNPVNGFNDIFRKVLIMCQRAGHYILDSRWTLS